MARRLKLPNGFGSIKNLGKRRRNPYAALITVGYDNTGKQIRKYIGYYPTYKDALNALSVYNTNPYSLELINITFKDAFNKWAKWKYPQVADSTRNGYDSAFKHLEIFYNKGLQDITTDMLQTVIDDKDIGFGVKRKIIVVFNQLYKFYVDDIKNLKDITTKIILPKSVSNTKVEEKIFTIEEIKLVWDNVNNFKDVDILLILLYTGFRINELLNIKTENVFLEEGYIIGGNKTKFSINRKVPIHHKIKPFIEKRYDKNKTYLIRNAKNERFKYSNYKRERFERLMDALDMKHTPHDTRHTVATYLQVNGADKIAIRQILGHAGKDITEQVYTHALIEDLRKNIELLDY